MRICDQLYYFTSFISQEVPCYLYGKDAEGRKEERMELSTDQQNDGGMLSSKTSSSLIIDAAKVGCYEITRRSRADWRGLYHSGMEGRQNVTLAACDSCVVRSLTSTCSVCMFVHGAYCRIKH